MQPQSSALLDIEEGQTFALSRLWLLIRRTSSSPELPLGPIQLHELLGIMLYAVRRVT